MFFLITDAGKEAVSAIVQIVGGSILAYLLYGFFVKKFYRMKPSFFWDIVIIIIACSAGILLPLSTYGIILIFISLISIGFRVYTVFPMIISNALFNMLVPFIDPTFAWKSGVNRILLALVIGCVSGLILKFFKLSKINIQREINISVMNSKGNVFRRIKSMTAGNMEAMGIYLVIGVLADSAFRRYFLWDILQFIYTNTSAIPSFFSSFDVANPYFLLSMTIATTLMNLKILSALLAVFKPKGILFYYGYNLVWIILLGISAFI